MTVTLRGVFVPLLTPFDAAEALDLPALERLVEFLLERGVHGLFVGGTTGEFPLLSLAERKRVAEVVVARAAGRVPVVVHAGATSTRDAIDLACHARQVGAPAVAVVSPYYFPLPEDALIEHFVRLSEAVAGYPVLLYNTPQRTGNALVPPVAAEIVRRCRNVVGIKDSTGNLAQTIEYTTLKDNFQVAQGADGLLVAGLAVGIQATVSGNANVFPEPAVEVFEAGWRGGHGAGGRGGKNGRGGAGRPRRAALPLSFLKGVPGGGGAPVGAARPP